MTSHSDYVHLHVHSHYSLLDGSATTDALLDAAQRCGMTALALTDHGNLFGAIDFYRKARRCNVKPILGMEAYIAEQSRLIKGEENGENSTFHVTLLAADLQGYQNLIKLTTQSYLDGFYRKPRIDHELLANHSAGLIALSGCLSGEIPRQIVRGDLEQAKRRAARYVDIMGRGNFYLELMSTGLPAQDGVRQGLIELGRRLDLPLVATNDVHYIQRADALAQEVMICISTGKTLHDQGRMRMDTDQYFFRSGLEMAEIFHDLPDAVQNTRAIADRCNVELILDQYHLPQYKPEKGENAPSFFRELCKQGLRQRYGNPPPPLAAERLRYEMQVIEEMGFVSYFLVVWDFIRFARENRIPVGPGRGSVAGSIVAYCLGITTIDPLRYDLLFERFLNSSRITMPDIDIDFCRDGREKVIRYVQEKHGSDCVCQIVTFGTMAAKAAIRDAGRVLGMDLGQIDRLAKKIPNAPGTKLADLLEDPELRESCTSDPEIARLFEVARKIEGLNRHASTHAAGVVIADRPLQEYVPLCRVQDEINTQFTMNDLEAIGLLKMDFLGLKTLTIIDQALHLIELHQGIHLDLEALPLDDPKTYGLLQRGETKGVFQLESDGMRELLVKMKPDCFEDIIAILALYRPGPLGSGMVDSFVNRKHGIEEISYLHPRLEPLLRETQGVILYQEQVMRIANVLAGFSLDEADTLRKAMGKKKKEVMERFRSKFIDGAMDGGIDRATAEAVWDQMAYFAGYGFNKSHSTAYGVITYRTAYLKANHPRAFMAALLTCESGNSDKVAEHLSECRRMGIPCYGPDLNRSDWEFSIEQEGIRIGLSAVKGVGEKAVAGLLETRRRQGVFRSLDHLAEHLDPACLGKGPFEALVKAGALDWTGHRRRTIYESADLVLRVARAAAADRRAGQRTLFDDCGTPPTATLSHLLPHLEDWPERERLTYEKEALGFYVTSNPLLKYAEIFERFSSVTPGRIRNVEDGREVVTGGIISELRFTTAKRGRSTGARIALFKIAGLDGSVSAILFPDEFRRVSEFIQDDRIALFTGIVDRSREEPSLKIQKVEPVERVLEEKIAQMILDVPDDADDTLLHGLKAILNNHAGPSPVFLRFRRSGAGQTVLRVAAPNYVRVSERLIEELERLLGKEQVSCR
ncbi:MAG: DNA polymerase III subunit alpha [Planctomycetota bacterium]